MNLIKQIKNKINIKVRGGIIMLMNFINYISSKVREEKGQGMVEYALLVGLIAVVVIAVLVLLGPAIAAKFTEIINAL